MSAVSDITVSGLTATPTLRGNKLAWAYSDPRAGAIPNIALDMVEVHASTTNDRTTATKVGEGITDFLHTGLVEEQTWYYWIKARDYLPAAQGGPGYGAWHPSGSTSGVPATAVSVSALAFGIANGKLVATVGSNALTIALKTAAGNDASASDPVFLAFRNATLATGNYQIRSVTAALSLVISSGSTMGFVSGAAGRLWVVLFDDAGTLRLGAINCRSGNTIYALAEFAVRSSTAEGGAGAADSSGVIYTGTAVTSKPFRILGYLDWNSGLATAGTWNAAPDVIQLFTPGGKTPGDTVQSAFNPETSVVQTTTAMPTDDTIPQNTEGGVFFTTSFTPTSTANIVEHDVEFNGVGSTNWNMALFKDSDANAFTARFCDGLMEQVRLRYRSLAPSTSAISYTVRAGCNTAVNLTLNGTGGSRLLGGVSLSYHSVTEIMG